LVGPTPVAPVAAVAFCAAASLAQDTLTALADNGRQTTGLLLADPVIPGRWHFERALHDVFSQIESAGADDARQELLADETLETDPPRWRGQLLARLAGLLAQSLRCAPDDEVVIGLAHRYIGYLDFLLSARAARRPGYPGRAVAVLSAEHTVTQPWPGLTELESVRSGSNRAGLLISPTFRRCLAELAGATSFDDADAV
jgi:hypothetical protein